jgi:hypothetical protein
VPPVAAAGQADIRHQRLAGPVTTQPMMESVIGVSICASRSSSVCTVWITLNPWRAQDGHDTRRPRNVPQQSPRQQAETGRIVQLLVGQDYSRMWPRSPLLLLCQPCPQRPNSRHVVGPSSHRQLIQMVVYDVRKRTRFSACDEYVRQDIRVVNPEFILIEGQTEVLVQRQRSGLCICIVMPPINEIIDVVGQGLAATIEIEERRRACPSQ